MLDTALAEQTPSGPSASRSGPPHPPTPRRGPAPTTAAAPATLEYLFTDAPTQASIRGTAWAGWQAITEYVDFYAPAPNQNRRAERTLTSATVTGIKQKAHDLLIPPGR